MLQATSATQHKDDDQTKKGADEPGEGGDDDPAETRDLSGNLKHLLWSLSHVYLSNAMHFRLRKPSWIDFEPKINLETDFNNPLEYWGNLLLYIYYSLNWLLLISDKEIYFVVFSSLQRQATCILFGICKFFFIFFPGIWGWRCSKHFGRTLFQKPLLSRFHPYVHGTFLRIQLQSVLSKSVLEGQAWA